MTMQPHQITYDFPKWEDGFCPPTRLVWLTFGNFLQMQKSARRALQEQELESDTHAHTHTKAQTKHTLLALKPNWFSRGPEGRRRLSTEAYSSSWKSVFITTA